MRLEQNAKDEKEWRATRAKLYAPPAHVVKAQRAAGQPQPAGMDLAAARALAARVAAEDAGFARR